MLLRNSGGRAFPAKAKGLRFGSHRSKLNFSRVFFYPRSSSLQIKKLMGATYDLNASSTLDPIETGLRTRPNDDDEVEFEIIFISMYTKTVRRYKEER